MKTTQEFHSNFAGLSSATKNQPDIFVYIHKKSIPDGDFVISRTIEGIPLSIYSDDIWDFTPYRPAGDSCAARMIFSSLPKDTINDCKWIMFLMLFISKPYKTSHLAISSLMGYMKPIRFLARYADKQDISIKSILSDDSKLSNFIKSLKKMYLIKNFKSILMLLFKIDPEISGYHIDYSLPLLTLERTELQHNDYEQHPVIPAKLYSDLISDLVNIIDESHSVLDNLISFVEKLLIDDQFGRSISQQHVLGYNATTFAPFFHEASSTYNLDKYLNAYNVSNIPSFSLFLTRLQHACRMLIIIFTGMRNSESLSLRTNCLVKYKVKDSYSYKIKGETSKYAGQKKAVSWITSVDILKAYDISNKLVTLVSKTINHKSSDIPLFISLSYLNLNTRTKFEESNIILARSGSKTSECYPLLDSTKYVISSDDINHLESINPFRAWASEKEFSIGSIWRFTSHQFRRSLAYYAAQSSLVSLPTLKRQLKHISREITIYYAHSMSMPEEFDFDDHISHLINNIKHEADAIAYINNNISNTETNYGAHGKYIETNYKPLTKDIILNELRPTLVKQFKKGVIVYYETSLGACVSTEPCNKRPLRLFSACINCNRAIIKLKKLKKTIQLQRIFVNNLLITKGKNSIEHKSELHELNALQKHLHKFTKKDTYNGY